MEPESYFPEKMFLFASIFLALVRANDPGKDRKVTDLNP